MAKTQLKVVEDQHELEYTHARIYAYLHALQPLGGCEMSEAHHRGRELVAILAETSRGDGLPKRRLTLSECADVLLFMGTSEPRNRKSFYVDQRGQPSVECGFHLVLDAIERTLRNPRKATAR